MFDLPDGSEIRGHPLLCCDPSYDGVDICEIELPGGYIIDVAKHEQFVITVYHTGSYFGDPLRMSSRDTVEAVIADINGFAKEFSR